MGEPLSVHIVDDNIDEGTSVQLALQRVGIDALLFTTAEELLASAGHKLAGCLILDVCLPGISGLQLQAALAQRRVAAPVIVI